MRDCSTKQTINHERLLDYLRLIRSTNVGPRTFHKLLKIFGTPSEALMHLNELAAAGGGKNKIIVPSIDSILDEIKVSKKFGAQIIDFNNENYPELLKQSPDSPPILVIKGNLSMLKREKIAIVGARNASVNGLRTAKEIAQQISEDGYVTVSGMAKGIDAQVHLSSIDRGTIGVIAGGINHIYPRENLKLFHLMYEKGCLISEYPFGKIPLPKYFPQRNRIIAALSLGVVVVEAASKSGTLITAHIAAEQGRDVFAVPGSPRDYRSQGTNQLLKQGAFLIESAEDVISVLRSRPSQHTLLEDPGNHRFTSERTEEAVGEDELAKYRSKVLDTITFAPVKVQDIVAYLGIKRSIVEYIVLELELAGKIDCIWGDRVVRME